MDTELERELVALAHEGVVSPEGWNPFVLALRQATGAIHANLTFRRADAPMSELTSFASGGPTEDMARFYFGTYHRTDPLPYYRLVPEKIYGLHDMFGLADDSVQSQVRILLEPFGNPHLCIVRITEPDGANAWLTVMRTDPPFDNADHMVLERLSRHLGIALQTYVKLIDARTRLTAYSGAMDRLNVGVLSLASDGRIIDADALVSRLLISGEIMARDPRGRMNLKDGMAARALGAALRDFTASASGRPRAVRLSEGERADMLLLPVDERPVTGRLTPVLRAYVHIERKPVSDGLETLIEMFRLTKSEARLALALAEGDTLAEASEKIGLTLQTARTYSKRIFQKTGTRRQAELVRTLLTSTLSLV